MTEPVPFADAPDEIAFTLRGTLTSNNRVTRRFGNRSVKSKDAAEDCSRVFQLAFAAAQQTGWEHPLAATLEIVAWNCRKDVGNIEKVIADGMIGAAYDDDSRLVRLVVEKRLDNGGERYDVRVRRCGALVKPKPPRAMRYEDLDLRERAALAAGTPGPLSEREDDTGRVILAASVVPASWRARAKRELL